jgi:hypothetical protein
MARISLDPPQTPTYRPRRSRVNSAFGLTAQGFRDRCELPSLASEAGPR